MSSDVSPVTILIRFLCDLHIWSPTAARRLQRTYIYRVIILFISKESKLSEIIDANDNEYTESVTVTLRVHQKQDANRPIFTPGNLVRGSRWLCTQNL